VGGAMLSACRVGVGADELDALHTAVDHDRVAAATADADHLDEVPWLEFFNFIISMLMASPVSSTVQS
jgi:hypothetical protein